MLAGIVGFLLAALAVESFVPGDGMAFELGYLAPLVYVLIFHLLQMRVAKQGRRLIETRILEGEGKTTRVETRPWPLVIFQVAGLVGCLFFGWSEFVQSSLGLAEYWFLPGALMFAPWLLVHVSWLVARRQVHEVLRPDPWPLGSYLAFHLRLLVIPIVPCLVGATFDWLVRSPAMQRVAIAYPSVQLAGGLVAAAIIVTFSPFLMRLALRSRSLEAGPLRASLEDLAARADFRALDIRVVESQERVVNALFVGVLGRLRYVFLTDGILKELSEEDLRGVFAHEMAHSRRGHIVLNLLLLLGFTISLHLMTASGLPEDSFIDGLFALLMLPVFFLFVFAPILRTWETEADVWAGEVLGDPGPIKRSLERLGEMYPAKVDRDGLTHPAIVKRLTFLEIYFQEPEIALSFQAAVRRRRRLIYAFFFLSALFWLASLPQEVSIGGIRYDVYQAVTEEDLPLAESALTRLEQGIEDGSLVTDPGHRMRAALWSMLASEYQKKGEIERARPFAAALADHRDDFDSPPAIYNAAIVSAQQAAAEGRWDRMRRETARAADEIVPVIESLVMLDEDRRRRLEEIEEGLSLEPLAELFADEEEIPRELRDIAFLRGLETVARQVGALPPAIRPGLLPANDRPEDGVLRSVGEDLRAGSFDPAVATQLVASLKPGWKRAALSRLVPAEAPANEH